MLKAENHVGTTAGCFEGSICRGVVYADHDLICKAANVGEQIR
jgi:hypothetical protein